MFYVFSFVIADGVCAFCIKFRNHNNQCLCVLCCCFESGGKIYQVFLLIEHFHDSFKV